MKKNNPLNNPVVIIAALVVGLLVLVSARNIMTGNFGSNTNNIDVPVNTDNAPLLNEKGEQVVTLKYINYKYELYPSTFLVNVPVRMEVDLNTVKGCMIAVRIPSFGVSKNVAPGDNVITFTPDKTGEFQIACSMGMGRNTFNVVDSSGKKDAYVEQPSAVSNGGSCGAGCGCGGKGL